MSPGFRQNDPTLNIKSLVADARRQLAPILNKSGNVLYSSVDTLRSGRIYLLGLNPGGDSKPLAWQTVGSTLRELPSQCQNQYIDVSWKGRPAGESKLQRRVRALAEMLNVDLRTICASNLIFVRSTGAHNCGYPNLAELCWPVHRRILDIVCPRLVICYGNGAVSPYSFLRSALNARDEIPFRSGHGQWRCRAFRHSSMRVVGLPHLSRYAIDRHPRVGGWLQRLLAE
jgi:hypothetical protein